MDIPRENYEREGVGIGRRRWGRKGKKEEGKEE